MADVKIPGLGTVPKKTAIIGGSIVALIGVAVIVRRKKNSAASAAATAANDATNANAIDPATGYVTGSALDTAALAGQQTGGLSGVSMDGSSSGTPNPQQPGFVSDSQWSQAAQTYLVNTTGLDAPTVGTAIGKYLAGEAVTDPEKAIIEQAIAAEGFPPVSGPNGYPPSIQHAAPAPAPTQLAAPQISVRLINAKQARIVWNPVSHATSYSVQGPDLLVRTTGPGITLNRGTGNIYVMAEAAGFAESKPSNYAHI